MKKWKPASPKLSENFRPAKGTEKFYETYYHGGRVDTAGLYRHWDKCGGCGGEKFRWQKVCRDCYLKTE